MSNSTVAKIFGWLTFGLMAAGQSIAGGTPANQSNPHGLLQWIPVFASFATALAVHKSANTDGTK